jgi:hypothetical protein
MGMIRGAVDKASSMKDILSPGRRRDPSFGGDRTLPAASYECPDSETDTIVGFDQAPDPSRSRGYGRYEI